VLQITPAERAVLQLLADGNATLEVAERLRLTEPVIDAMLTGLLERMGVGSPAEALVDAQRRGLVSIGDAFTCKVAPSLVAAASVTAHRTGGAVTAAVLAARLDSPGQNARTVCNIGTQPVIPAVYGVKAPL
jgi:DNA-binding CsgD family transcriptional regulator